MTAVHVWISTLSSSVSPEHRAQSLSRDCAAAVPAISRTAARPKIGTECRTTFENSGPSGKFHGAAPAWTWRGIGIKQDKAAYFGRSPPVESLLFFGNQ